MTNLDGAVFLVVGASGGLGSLIAEQLADAGAVVVRAARNPATLAGPDAYLADLTQPSSAEGLMAAAVAAHGRLDGLVIAAGRVAFGPIAEVSDATLTELFEINALAPMRLIREALPHLTVSAAEKREPVIVTISGIVAESPTAGLASYSASKAALAGFVTAANRELRRAGIRVMDARPGHTETALSTHPIAGAAPAFPAGLAPEAVVARIVRGIVDGEKDLPSGSF